MSEVAIKCGGNEKRGGYKLVGERSSVTVALFEFGLPNLYEFFYLNLQLSSVNGFNYEVIMENWLVLVDNTFAC